MLKVIKFPNEVLRTPAPLWDFENNSNAEQLEKDMIETMFAYDIDAPIGTPVLAIGN